MSSVRRDIDIYPGAGGAGRLGHGMAMSSVALPLTRPLAGRRLAVGRHVSWRSPVVVTLNESERTDRLVRLAVPGAMAYAAVFPVVQVAVIAESWGGGYAKGAWALAATAAYLPLHLRHVAHGVRGTHPPAGGWSLAAMAALILGVLPLAGSLWLPSCHALVVSALIVLRPPWSWLAAGSVVAAQAPLAWAVGSLVPAAGSYYTVTAVWRASSVVVPLWLARTILQLHAARRALADEAVVRERVRMDAEVRRTLGTALDAIVSRGRQAGAALALDPRDPALEAQLRTLVDGSRRALADARRLVRGYQQGSLRSEIDTAAGLLAAAGVRTRLVLPAGRLPDTVDAGARDALRAATAQVLRDDTTRACAITVSLDDGHVRLDLRRDDVPAGRREVAR
jgi:two-component system, NarL family, sensor histidine kinase DesK